MAANDFRLALRAAHAHDLAVSTPLERDAIGVETDGYAFVDQHVVDGLRDVLVLAGKQPRAALDHGDLRTEAAEHLREFETDIAAAHDHEVGRQFIEVKDGRIGEIADLLGARINGHSGAPADVEEDARGRDAIRVHRHLPEGGEAGVPLDQSQVFGAP